LHVAADALEDEAQKILRMSREAMAASRRPGASEESRTAATVLFQQSREAGARHDEARVRALAGQASWWALEKEAKEKDAAPPPLSAEEEAARDENLREVKLSLLYGSNDEDDEDDEVEDEQPKASRKRPGKSDPRAAADRDAKKRRKLENKDIDRRIRENEDERQKLCMELSRQYDRKPDDIRARFPSSSGMVKKRRKVSIHNALMHEISKVWTRKRFLCFLSIHYSDTLYS